MTSNHKLTTILHGRTIQGVNSDNAAITIWFDDGSNMTVQKSADCLPSKIVSGEVDKVRQEGTDLALDLTDGSTIALTTADETSCVMVRDKNHAMEYAD